MSEPQVRSEGLGVRGENEPAATCAPYASRLTPHASRTLLIIAGGTGGHVFPALAVADYLKERGWKVVWLGTRAGMESRLVPGKGYEMAWVKFAGMRGKGVLRWAALPLMLLLAMWQSAAAIFRIRPDVVLGMGGYTAFPGGLMASLLARPLVIHEQNSVAGLTNRVLACLADRVLVAFPSAFNNSGDKPIGCRKLALERCGNPVRADIAALPAPEQRMAGRQGRLRLLVVGGSLGAAALNEAVPQALALIAETDCPEVIHQSGAKNLEKLRANYAAAGVAADARAFIDDMAQMYAWCDVIVCRAGALTLAEVTAAGVASVLVPYPHAVDDHQTGNARFLSENGAAVLLPQTELNAEKLAELLHGFTREKLLAMAQAAKKLAKPEATADVARVCMELAG
ncbi:MAG: undecaprenyldiphospho-muramoylpentapeptide beta-N-acetylglucosaminyltransferase [Hydrogenophilales bacterium CG_4_9_14_3_um_filter_59_35]|nr:MAG: undecaprenyldiphospho-muramoylpentapeptide beta-N-acetylglucosaminyltransferase [Hydrogenophilales bacterium CG18_big_fil_WC_8_21_14_2_50_58_12]PIY01889.1 MAG: undecaprenyldiphospho-muramoylpentapeptide beta-N-acetylglucosaminyltransferase [Hydrogenophilales bacterium CG_4_10_14_3_um_filter_58_23]PJB07372.1 MAG: undecaprenyldiphospho-muramoylpentapeptide beta-N-acetylglucosaminyltransferase [Hydrogenophilales bacterium CG_4_9_14_3_um_filter_59_35]